MSAEVGHERFIPYLATAKALADADESPRLFLSSLFPNATEEQLALMHDYTAGKLLDGIHYGLALSAEEPMTAIEAYKFGILEGQDQAIHDQQKRDERS